MRPSSTRILSPTFVVWHKCSYVVETFFSSPRKFWSVVNVNSAPFSKKTLSLFFNLPLRISGPFVSSMRATIFPNSLAASRTFRITDAWYYSTTNTNIISSEFIAWFEVSDNFYLKIFNIINILMNPKTNKLKKFFQERSEDVWNWKRTSWVPWEKFKRATVIPAFIMAFSVSLLLVGGPMVHTIWVFVTRCSNLLGLLLKSNVFNIFRAVRSVVERKERF